MGTVYRKTNRAFAQVLTTRTISIGTDAATKVVATSGAQSMQVFNIGAGTIAWGDSSIAISSGGLLFYSMSEIFSPIQGDYSMYFRADSVATIIAVNEFE